MGEASRGQTEAWSLAPQTPPTPTLPTVSPGTCSPRSSKPLAELRRSRRPAAHRSRRPCWAGCTSFDSRNVSPAPRRLAVSWNSNSGIPTPTDSHLQLQQKSLCGVWVSPGGHVSLPGLGEEARVVCGMKSRPPMCVSALHIAQSHCPRGRMGSAFPGLGSGVREGAGPAHQARCPVNPRPDRQAARVCILPVQQVWSEQRGSCSDTLFSR